MDKKFNEFEVTGKLVKGKFVIAKKEPTERGHVMISERDADTNNRQTRFNKLHYELDKPVETPEQKAAKEEKAKRTKLLKVVRKDLKLTVANTATTEELETLIKENQK